MRHVLGTKAPAAGAPTARPTPEAPAVCSRQASYRAGQCATFRMSTGTSSLPVDSAPPDPSITRGPVSTPGVGVDETTSAPPVRQSPMTDQQGGCACVTAKAPRGPSRPMVRRTSSAPTSPRRAKGFSAPATETDPPLTVRARESRFAGGSATRAVAIRVYDPFPEHIAYR